MQIHLNELDCAKAYESAIPFEPLTRQQLGLIRDYGHDLERWFRKHQVVHNLISAAVILFLLVGDWFLLMCLPRWLSEHENTARGGMILLNSVIVGSLHSWVIYSMVVYSIHEGAAHKLIFLPIGPMKKLLHLFASNLCRLGGADPAYYAANHRSHHAGFGTESDGEFLNFVLRRRFWVSLFPFAMFLNFSDFVVHRDVQLSKSLAVSMALSIAYNIVYGHFMLQSFGLSFTILTLLVVLPHVGFYLDRLRQFTEHNLMPLENKDGARSFGIGFWGLLIGGGPWGQPCHWMHHLVPRIPWYQQILLHRYAAKVLTPTQKRQYLLRPVIGFPKLLIRLWRETNSFSRMQSR